MIPVLAFLLAPCSPPQTLTFATIAESGDAAAGTTEDFESFEHIAGVDNFGNIVFSASLTGGASTDAGIWMSLGGSVTLVAREGDAAPGTTGTFSWSSGLPYVLPNDAEQVAFRSSAGSAHGL